MPQITNHFSFIVAFYVKILTYFNASFVFKNLISFLICIREENNKILTL